MKRFFILLNRKGCFLFLITLSSSVFSNNFSYSDIRLGITSNPGSVNGSIRGTFHPHAHFIAAADSRLKGDWNLSVGAGFHAPLKKGLDLHGNTRFYYTRETDTDKYDLGTVAVGLQLGLRAMLSNQLEINGIVGKISSAESKSVNQVELGFQFHSTEKISLGINYRFQGIYDDQYFLSVNFPY